MDIVERLKVDPDFGGMVNEYTTLTLRDVFAALALIRMVGEYGSAEATAQNAYIFADAMLTARAVDKTATQEDTQQHAPRYPWHPTEADYKPKGEKHAANRWTTRS